MLFWIAAAVLTALACLSVLSPFLGRRREAASTGDHALSVYRDQLDEVERDRMRGLIQPLEAEQARTEIARRMLKDEVSAGTVSRPRHQRFSRVAGMAGVLAIPILSWGIYGATGSPELPAQPLAARNASDAGEQAIATLIARAEQKVTANPEDGRGWDVLAPIYLRVGRPADAVTAYRNAIRLLGDDPARYSGMGEALVVQAGGAVSPDALQAFDRALTLAPADGRANFYRAFAAVQTGRSDDARQQFAALRDRNDIDGAWRNAAAQALTELDGAQEAARGPTREDVENAESMNDADRTAMIETMVTGLDARLRENPDDLEGWQRLIQSYLVLGRPADARSALERATASFAGDAARVADLRAFADEAGLSRGVAQ